MSKSHSQKNAKYNLFLAKAIFFTNSLSTVGWGRFQNNFYLGQGLSAYEIGSLKSIGLILKVFGEPLWSFIADMWDPKYIFVLCMIVQIATMEMLRNIRPVTFNLILLVKFLRTVSSSNNTLVTSAAFRLTEGSNEGYGKQRLYGSLAWGSGALATGILIDNFGMNALFYYTYIFVGVNFILVILGYPSKQSTNKATTIVHAKSEDFSSQSTPFKHDKNSNNSTESISTLGFQQYYKDMTQFFSHLPTRVILVNALGYGAVMTVIDTYLYISLEIDYHVSRTFSGICTSASILSCLPVFYYSDKLIEKYGNFRLIILAQIVCVLRLIAYGMLAPTQSSIYVILLLQALHGINFALYWAASVDAIYKLAPKNMTASCLSTLNIMFFTLSGAIGNYVWGYIYSRTGEINFLYLLGAAILSGVVILLHRSENILQNGLIVAAELNSAKAQLSEKIKLLESQNYSENNIDSDSDNKSYNMNGTTLSKQQNQKNGNVSWSSSNNLTGDKTTIISNVVPVLLVPSHTSDYPMLSPAASGGLSRRHSPKANLTNNKFEENNKWPN